MPPLHPVSAVASITQTKNIFFKENNKIRNIGFVVFGMRERHSWIIQLGKTGKWPGNTKASGSLEINNDRCSICLVKGICVKYSTVTVCVVVVYLKVVPY